MCIINTSQKMGVNISPFLCNGHIPGAPQNNMQLHIYVMDLTDMFILIEVLLRKSKYLH